MAEPITLSILVGGYILGTVNSVFQGCLSSHVDRHTSKFFERRDNHDIQDALQKAWESTCKQIQSNYLKKYEKNPLDQDVERNIKRWVEQLTSDTMLEQLFPKVDSTRVSAPDLKATNTALDQQLKTTDGWDTLPQDFQSLVRTHLVDGLLFNFIEVAIKAEPKARDAIFFQQFGVLRDADTRIDAAIDSLRQELEARLDKREDITKYREQVTQLLQTLDQRTERMDQKLDQIIANQGVQPIFALLSPKIPAPVPDFVGRHKDITDLVHHLSAVAPGEAAIGIIRGMGGVGKTQLALKVVQEIKGAFDGPQLRVRLLGASKTPLESVAALQDLIRQLLPETTAQLPTELDQLQTLYCNLLDGKRAIVLADDAGSAAQVRPLMPASGCALIVTSRRRFILPGAKLADLATMPESDADTLLTTIFPRIGADAPTIAKLCGYLPLALRVSASYLLNDDARSIKSYIRNLENEQARLKHLRDRDENDPELDVEASLNLSYQALTPQLQLVMQQLSVFPASFDQLAAKAVVEADDELEEDMLDQLRVRSLIEQDAATQRYTLHDLVRTFAAGKLSAQDAPAAKLRHAQWYVHVAEVSQWAYLQGNENTFTGLFIFDLERINIDVAWTWARAQKIDNITALILIGFGNATANVGELRYDARSESIPQFEATLLGAQFFEDKNVEMSALVNLGSTYITLGDANQAIEYYQLALTISREIGDRRGEGAILGNLGLAYASLGDIHKAIDFYQQQLLISREISERRDESNALNNLGNASADLGDIHQAIEFYEERLIISREIGDHRGEGTALDNIGIAYADLGDISEAIKYQRLALNIMRRIGDRRGEGGTLSNLGNSYARLGNTRRAIKYHRQALKIMRKSGDRRGEGIILDNLGIAYAKSNDSRRAIGFYQKALKIMREIGDRQGESIVSLNLGIIFLEQGKSQKGFELLDNHLDFMEDIGHNDTDSYVAIMQLYHFFLDD